MQEKLWLLYDSFQPKRETQKIFLRKSVEKIDEASRMRRQRIFFTGSGINTLIYFALIIGSFIIITFTMMFGTENIVPHIIMTALLSALITLTLFMVIALDHPFRGNISIKLEVFTSMLSFSMNSQFRTANRH